MIEYGVSLNGGDVVVKAENLGHARSMISMFPITRDPQVAAREVGEWQMYAE